MAGRVTAQTFRTLHSFDGGTNGCYVVAGLVLSSNALYGTARFGGIFDRGEEGMLFKVNTDGTGFTILHSFTPSLVSPVVWTNVSPGPVVVASQNAATSPGSGAQRFYRLSQ